MVKRDDSGSGLRAGFVRGDGLNQQPRKNTPAKPEEPAVKPLPPAAEPPAREPEELTGPTLTMQGVSGKKITGAVKVIKVIKADKPSDHETGAVETAAAAHIESAPLAEKPPVEVAKPAAAEAAKPAVPVEKPAPADRKSVV